MNLLDIQKKASITWTVYSYANYCERHRPVVKSPTFSPPNDENIKFFLRFTGKYLFPTETNDQHKQSPNLFYSLSLCMESPIMKKMSVYYKIALVDSAKRKQFPYEGRAEFHSFTNDLSKPFGQEARHGMEVKYAQMILHSNSDRFDISFCCEVFVLDNSKAQIIDDEFVRLTIPKNPENYGTLLKSDVILVVGEKEFNLHKIILAGQSPVFKDMFDSDLEENKQNRFIITDMEIEVAELLVSYIYTKEMPPMNKYALKLFIASEKYQLEHLKTICEKTLTESLSVENVAKTLLLADIHNVAFLKTKSIEFITENSEKVKTTKGWSELLESRPDLLIELYNNISRKLNSFLLK